MYIFYELHEFCSYSVIITFINLQFCQYNVVYNKYIKYNMYMYMYFIVHETIKLRVI